MVCHDSTFCCAVHLNFRLQSRLCLPIYLSLPFQVILHCNALPCLLSLLSHTKESIRKEACWTISNITAGNRAQIQVHNVLLLSVLSPIVSRHYLITSLSNFFLRDIFNTFDGIKVLFLSSSGSNHCSIWVCEQMFISVSHWTPVMLSLIERVITIETLKSFET